MRNLEHSSHDLNDTIDVDSHRQSSANREKSKHKNRDKNDNDKKGSRKNSRGDKNKNKNENGSNIRNLIVDNLSNKEKNFDMDQVSSFTSINGDENNEIFENIDNNENVDGEGGSIFLNYDDRVPNEEHSSEMKERSPRLNIDNVLNNNYSNKSNYDDNNDNNVDDNNYNNDIDNYNDVWAKFDQMEMENKNKNNNENDDKSQTQSEKQKHSSGLSYLPSWLGKPDECPYSTFESLDIKRKKVVNSENLKTGALTARSDLKPFIPVINGNNYELKPPLKMSKSVKTTSTSVIPQKIRKLNDNINQIEERDRDRDTYSLQSYDTNILLSRHTQTAPKGVTRFKNCTTARTKGSGTTHVRGSTAHVPVSTADIDPITLNVAAFQAVFKANSLSHSLIELKSGNDNYNSNSYNSRLSPPHTQSPTHTHTINTPLTSINRKYLTDPSTAPSPSISTSVYRKSKVPKSASGMKIKNYLEDLTFSRNHCDSLHYFSKTFSQGPPTT